MAENPLDKKADPGKCFYCENGMVFYSINDLKEVLTRCTNPELRKFFDSHVKGYKNDFSAWIGDVFGLQDLASRIAPVKDPQELLSVIEQYEQDLKSNNLSENLSVSGKIDISEKNKKENFKDIEKTSEDDKNLFTQQLKDEINQRSERSYQEFEKVKRIKHHSFYNKADFADSIESLKNRYEELQSKISELRREGKDMSIPAMMLRNTLPKITYFQVSQKDSDYQNVLTLFEDIIQEINYANKEKKKDLRTEIMEAIGLKLEKKEER